MIDIFNPATRTAYKLQQRSPQGRYEMLFNAFAEGYAVLLSDGYGGTPYTIEWHGLKATGTTELDAIADWINQVENTAEGLV